MIENAQLSTATPQFSVIIGVFNDWAPLDHCLASLAQQTNGPSFEVIVVDDGSSEPAPEFIRRWDRNYPLIVIQQAHAGVAAARNRGLGISRGSLLVFADADCRFQANCLADLESVVSRSPEHNCFQLHLVGDCSTVVGRVEELRLVTLQNHQRQPNGCIRYLNTAGFAIRRAKVNTEELMFEPAALRAEDTLLLANLMQHGELPLFVPTATVQHAISLSLMGYFLKGIWSAYQEGRTYDIIALMGVRIRVSHRERLSMLSAMWGTSGLQAIGRPAWFLLAARQSLRLMASYVYRIFRGAVQLSHLDELAVKNTNSHRFREIASPNRTHFEIPDNLGPEFHSKVR
jgi:glycosyltransferase involved in cell wall biosynthesis